MKINFIVDIPFRNPDKHLNVDYLRTRKELSYRLDGQPLFPEVDKYTNTAYTHALEEAEQLEVTIKNEVLASQGRNQTMQSEARAALRLIGALQTASGESKPDVEKSLKEMEGLVTKMLQNFTQSASKYDDMLIQTNVLNKRLKTMLMSGITEIEGLSAIDRRLSEERGLIEAEWQKKLEELRNKLEGEKAEVARAFGEMDGRVRLLEQEVIAKDVELERISGLFNGTLVELKQQNEENERLRTKVEDANSYIAELIRKEQEQAAPKLELSQAPQPTDPGIQIDDIKRWIKAVYEGLFTRPEEVLNQSRINFVNDALQCSEFSDAEAILNRAVEDAMEKTALNPEELQHPSLGMVVFKILSGVVLREYTNNLLNQNVALRAHLVSSEGGYQ